MKNFVKFMVVGISVASLALACEPGGGADAETSTGNGNGNDTNVTPPVEDFGALEIFDDPSNPTLNPCDGGALATPGADIDAAELDTSGSIAQLTSCAGPSSTGSCANDMNNASAAEGGPDGDTENGFVALNGGYIRCNWDSGAAARSGQGQVITIYEIGGAGGGKVENYGARLCKGTAGNCKKDSGFGAGNAQLQADSLF